ncbi:hypothetical protein C1J05_06750 [Sulfitobacter sp. JL08]|nr:hypothetical protein C1J05_06750 [Sulfitobacter sp. JL08]
MALLAATKGMAQSEANPDPAECQSCTARHQSLQALQAARTKPEQGHCEAAPSAQNAEGSESAPPDECADQAPAGLLPPSPED